MSMRRLAKEARSFVADETVLALSPGDRLDEWTAVIAGPPDSPYRGGRFSLAISVPPGYPIEAPEIRFTSRCCHPNVDWKSGRICLDLLAQAWSPSWTLRSSLVAIALLLAVCSPYD